MICAAALYTCPGLRSGPKTPSATGASGMVRVPFPNNHLQVTSVREAFQNVRDVGLHEAVIYDRLRLVFAEVDRLGIAALRAAQAREARDVFDKFVGMRIRPTRLDPNPSSCSLTMRSRHIMSLLTEARGLMIWPAICASGWLPWPTGTPSGNISLTQLAPLLPQNRAVRLDGGNTGGLTFQTHVFAALLFFAGIHGVSSSFAEPSPESFSWNWPRMRGHSTYAQEHLLLPLLPPF